MILTLEASQIFPLKFSLGFLHNIEQKWDYYLGWRRAQMIKLLYNNFNISNESFL